MNQSQKIKLLSIDLDGTLLYKNKNNHIIKQYNWKITNENLVSLSEFIAKGNNFNFATGRSYTNLIKYIEIVENALNYKIPYIVCLNGSLIYDNINCKIIKHAVFEQNDLAILLEFLYQKKLTFFAQSFSYKNNEFEDKTFIKKTPIVYKFIELNFNKNQVVHFDEELPKGIYSKITIIITKPQSNKLKKELIVLFGNKFNFCLAGRYAIEINPHSVNKFSAIQTIIKEMNLNLNQVGAIGDQDNDYLLIKNVGFGVGVDVDQKKYLKHISDVADLIISNKKGTAVADAITKMNERNLI